MLRIDAIRAIYPKIEDCIVVTICLQNITKVKILRPLRTSLCRIVEG
jgi:hypothetical protein